MRVRVKKVFVFYCAAMMLLVVSCKPDFPSWETEAVFPAFHARMTLTDIDKDSLLVSDPDSMLRVFYEYSLTDFDIDSLITGLDTIASYTYTSPITITLPPGAQVLDKAEMKRLGVSGVYLSDMFISSGFLKVKALNKYTQPIVIEYTIPSATIGGSAFSIIREIPAAPSTGQNYVYEELIDITAMDWDFYTIGINQYNCFDTQFKVRISPNATENVQVNFGDPFIFYIGFEDIVIGYARGWFGQQSTAFDETEPLDIFKNIAADDFSIEDVDLIFEVTNNMGVDFQLKITELSGTNTHNGTVVSYAGPFLNQPIQITRATEVFPEQGVAYAPHLIIDLEENSNLKDFVENMPGEISFSVCLDINPLGNPSAGNDFYYGVPLDAKLSLSMPLFASLTNLSFSDTTDFSGDVFNKPVNGILLRTVVNNCFPYELDMSMTFADSLGNILFLLPFSQPVAAAVISGGDRTDGPRSTTIYTEIPVSNIEALRQADQIILHARVSSLPYGQNVKIFSDYYIDIQSFAVLNLLINSDE